MVSSTPLIPPSLPVERGCCSSRSPSTMHAFTVTYNSENHFQVLLQMWGSIWPRVMPYCFLNVGISILLQSTESLTGFDWQVTDKGHSYMTMLVAFLVVSRATVSLGRYSQVRQSLTQVYCQSRAVVDQMVIFSSDNINQSGKLWRHDVAYLALLQLRSIMAVMDYQSDGIPFWDMPEVDEALGSRLKSQLFLEESTLKFAHHTVVSEYEENMRVPIRLGLQLRQAIINQRKELDQPFSWPEEGKLLGAIDGLMAGYYGIRSFLTTPFPFPLVQMSRTFLFFYLFTTPFALLQDVSKPIAHNVVIFFLTFGFMGLEYVSIELDDPFGRDSNDFNNGRMAQVCFEDSYMSIVDMDGEEWTDKLRKKMDGGRGEDVPRQATAWLHGSVEV